MAKSKTRGEGAAKEVLPSILDGEEGLKSPVLGAVLRRAAQAPSDEALWDEAESLADQEQNPELVAEVLRECLERTKDAELAEALGQRAVRFHDEWFTETEPLLKVLDLVLAHSPSSGWAFERLSLVLTQSERWSELLQHYDGAIAAEQERGRRMTLLEEAAEIARNFAAQPERAMGYLEQLVELRPTDAKLANTLERLLEREEKYDRLVRLWRLRLEHVPVEQQHALRERIAVVSLEKLSNPASALEAIEQFLAASPEGATRGRELLERLLAEGQADDATRAAALARLESLLEESDYAERIRVLGVALPFTPRAQRAPLHRRLAELHGLQGNRVDALSHWAALFELSPEDEEIREHLRVAGRAAGDLAGLARALIRAAGATEVARVRVSLLGEAGQLRSDELQDLAGAVEVPGQSEKPPTVIVAFWPSVGAEKR